MLTISICPEKEEIIPDADRFFAGAADKSSALPMTPSAGRKPLKSREARGSEEEESWRGTQEKRLSWVQGADQIFSGVSPSAV